MKEAGFRFKDHTADILIESWGKDLNEAFEQSALSVMAIISPDLNKIKSEVSKKIALKAEDKEALLFDFLSEFLYIFDVENLIFKTVKVNYIKKTNSNYEISAIAKGEKFNLEKHEIGTEVKAITYSQMKIEENEEKTEINLVVDI
ncbi:MAG: archease [Candidatus Lokiarchaeota archaeon]|nr:archease [Candidatus Lokiarchaeota archaeon]